MEKSTCILGVGNTLLTDEGFGVRAMEYLRDEYDWPEYVDFVDGGTLGLSLMPTLMDYERIVVLDIVRGQGAPGTVYLLENEDMRKAQSFHDSTHDTDFVDLLNRCELISARPDAFVVGFEPFDYTTMAVELTPEAQKRLPEFCEKAVKEIMARNIANPVKKTDSCLSS